MQHVIPYSPRPLQWQFHEERKRFCVLLCHRRFGKTVAAVNDLSRRRQGFKSPWGRQMIPRGYNKNLTRYPQGVSPGG